MNKKHYAEFVLANYEDAREDDSKLLLYHLRRYGCFLDKDQSKAFLEAFKLISADVLIRYRQSLNSKGKYLPKDPKVLKARRIKQNKLYQEFNPNPELSIPTISHYKTWVDEQGIARAIQL